MNRCAGITIGVLAAAIMLTSAAPAAAFNAGPHQEMTASALTEAGFEGDSIGMVQINNWFVDLYHDLSAHKIGSSGKAGFGMRLLLEALGAEDWPSSVIAASTRSHFDNWPEVSAESQRPDLASTAGLTAEWSRLQGAVWTLMREARDRNDPEMGLEVLGISLHPVQDFYTHTNWIEPLAGRDIPGVDGPGWQERGYGSYPTWFDIPASEREKVELYGDNTPGHARWHGLWNEDGNTGLITGMNKDWPGRPYYMQAAITAYYASAQWIEAVRRWVDDDAFWARMQHFKANQSELDRDLKGRYEIMLYSGQWQGQGEPWGGKAEGPGGNLLDLRGAVKDYFQVQAGPPIGGQIGPSIQRGRTKYRARFEGLLKRVADPNAVGYVGPVPSSTALQASTKIVVLRIPFLNGQDLDDPWPGEADMFANVGIDGQRMTSAVINNADDFTFPRPYAPFTWFKVVPAVPVESEPVETIEAEVKTCNAWWAGTDDDVFLRLGNSFRFPIEKNLYNDFESGDRDTYSVPIDAAVRRGMRVGDITRVGLEKSPDRLAGGWKLCGLELRVNGQTVYNNQRVSHWLEDDHRIWTGQGFEPDERLGQKIPVWIDLREDDSIFGADDEGDINLFDSRNIVSIGYAPGEPREAKLQGGDRLGGRLGYGGDKAALRFRLTTITPELAHAEGQPPAPPSERGEGPGPGVFRPDLVISSFTLSGVTVTNRGAGPAGPFRLSVNGGIRAQFPGLAPGASETRVLALSCNEDYFAMVDDLEQVAETDEENNTAEAGATIC